MRKPETRYVRGLTVIYRASVDNLRLTPHSATFCVPVRPVLRAGVEPVEYCRCTLCVCLSVCSRALASACLTVGAEQ